MGQDPASDRPQAGKATIIRAFKIEKARLERLQRDVAELKGLLARSRRLLWAALGVAGALAVGLVGAIIALAAG